MKRFSGRSHLNADFNQGNGNSKMIGDDGEKNG
jgi:hypothetical protein